MDQMTFSKIRLAKTIVDWYSDSDFGQELKSRPENDIIAMPREDYEEVLLVFLRDAVSDMIEDGKLELK